MADMTDVPSGLYYTEDHEYVMPTEDDGVYQVGITEYAQGELGDIVFVELPDEGEQFERAEAFGTVEAVKAVNDLYCPAAGEVVEVNEALEDDPSLVNREPYGAGWMVMLRIRDDGELEQLMDSDDYAAQIEGAE